MTKEKIQNFKDLILELYDRFPNGRLSEIVVHKVVKIQEDMDKLVDEGYLTINKLEGIKFYGLAPNSLNLVVALKTEILTKRILQLTNQVKWLTFLIFGLTILMVIRAFF